MKTETERIYRERILRALIHIQENLDGTLSLQEIAEVAHFSPYHFHRIFRGMVGEGVQEHVRRIRLERAAHRLKFSQQEITTLAFDAGYEAPEAFTKAFRTRFGEPPSAYRKRKHDETIDAPEGTPPSGVHYLANDKVSDFRNVPATDEPYPLWIKKVEPIKVAFIRHVGPYQEVGDAWQRLMGWAGSKQLLGPMMTLVGVVYDDPEVTPPDKIRYDACLRLHVDIEPEQEIGVREIAGDKFVSTIHMGPYENLSQTYARMCGVWLAGQSLEPVAGPGLEFYKNSPLTTPPEKLHTDVYLPVAPITQGAGMNKTLDPKTPSQS